MSRIISPVENGLVRFHSLKDPEKTLKTTGFGEIQFGYIRFSRLLSIAYWRTTMRIAPGRGIVLARSFGHRTSKSLVSAACTRPRAAPAPTFARRIQAGAVSPRARRILGLRRKRVVDGPKSIDVQRVRPDARSTRSEKDWRRRPGHHRFGTQNNDGDAGQARHRKHPAAERMGRGLTR